MQKEKGRKENIRKWKTLNFSRGKVKSRFSLSIDLRPTTKDKYEGNQLYKNLNDRKDKEKDER